MNQTAQLVTDCTLSWRANEEILVLNFENMPPENWVKLRRLHEGQGAETCDRWLEAASCAVGALTAYLGRSRIDWIRHDGNHNILIQVARTGSPTRIWNTVQQYLTERADITVA